MNNVIIGTQWGDEGKGKIVDFLAKDCAVVVRFQGGNNAGHTVVHQNHTYKLHLIPSGILYPDKICVLGNGMVIDPAVLLDEMTAIQKEGCSLKNLYISERAHVIMPYHKLFDALEEKMKGAEKIGTTMRGIGPCYSDKVARMGIRMVDLLNTNIFKKLVAQTWPVKLKILQAFGETSDLTESGIVSQYLGFTEKLRSYVTDTTLLLNQLVAKGQQILFEGAQGSLLGVDHGTYPFVTASETTSGNACCGSGVAPIHMGKIMGVMKAYTSRVGSGWFPTELTNETGQKIREQGHEYGTTTGRPRRCGWLDLAAVKYAVMVNGITELAVTKLDVLQGIHPLQICTGYSYQGKKLNNFPADLDILNTMQPVYEEISGWQDDISKCTSFEKLPAVCQKYLRTIESYLEVSIRIVSVGADRNQTIVR